jgi:transposase InsO family protein
MNVHANAKLGLAGRRRLVLTIESGASMRAAAAAFGVSPAAAHRWWHRALEGESLADRSSRPHRQPRRLSAAEEEPILRARRETSLGPGRPAGIVRRARSTVWKVLHRRGVSRLPKGERHSYCRCEWSRPGALPHMDVKRLARFSRPGQAAPGDRRRSRLWSDKNAAVGYDYCHVVVDDNSRLAYVELHPREDADTNARTLKRAIAWFAELGLAPPEAVMTDNAFVYVHGRPFKQLLSQHQLRHIRTPPYTPRWNGKAERFIQPLQREWGYASTWPDSTARARTPASFLRYSNKRRPHSSLRDRPPLSRVHNLRGQDT